MAIRYSIDYFEDRDVIAPVDWTENQNEYASEFNGYLDEDNLPTSALNAARIKDNAFTKLHSDPLPTSTFTVDISTAGWQSTDSTGQRLGSLAIDAKTDGLFICEWSGTHRYVIVPSGRECIAYRLLVDGVTVAESGWTSFTRPRDSVYLCGATPVAAGLHAVEAQVRVIALESALFVPANATTIYVASAGGVSIYVDERELFVKERSR